MQGNITDWCKKVKGELIDREWSVTELAEKIGKSRERVSGVVNGRIYSQPIVSAISDTLNIEATALSMKDSTSEWRKRAKKELIARNMTIKELAEKAGYSYVYVGSVLSGNCYSKIVVDKISFVLGIKSDEQSCVDS